MKPISRKQKNLTTLRLEKLETRQMLSTVPNGGLDETHLAGWQQEFGTVASASSTGGDVNGDGKVTGSDFLDWQRNYSNNQQIAPIVSVADANAARNALLSGVSQIASVGAPGQIAVFDPPAAGAGQGAFGVIHDGDYRPMVAAAIWGSGKVVAFGHNGYTDFSGPGNTLDTGQFYRNSVAWTTGAAGTAQTIVTNSNGTRNWLVSQGYSNVSVHSNWESFLGGADLLIVELGPNVSAAKQAAVSSFVQGGGGLITGGTGWGYKQLGNDLKTLDGNEVLREAGIAWADGFRSGTTDATNRSTELANASQALTFAQQLWAGGSGTSAQQEEAGEALQTVLEVLPDTHPLAIAIAAEFSGRASSISATPATPVSDPLDKAVLTWESNQLANTPVAQVTAHHTAEAVYGTIPVDAPRVTDQVTLDGSQTRWHATGLYAAPGEIVTITVPASLVGKGYKLRLNAHTDNISQRGTWERMPVVHRSFDINQATIQVASAFGGSIFFDFGGNAYSLPPNFGNVNVTIDGAIRQPYFVLGEHTDQQWNDTFRDYPAPYAVFATDNLIIVQRSSESASLTQPTALMNWWKNVVDQQDELANRLESRTGAEIINVDVQQSAGAAHAGFPIQAYDKHWGNLADYNSLITNGSWGDFHELGHNKQRGWWTFSGDGEVTVNIFSNYNLENSASNPVGGWAWTTDPVEVIQRATNDVAGGGSYSSKSNRWSFWHQLSDGFGWDAYRNVFLSYEADNGRNPGALPSNDQQEKDQWFTRWSNEVGYDMKRFMVDTWGLSVSQSAINSVAALPDWMPLATTITDFQIEQGNTRLISPVNAGRSMDGTATFVSISQPQSGTLTNNNNGTYTYEPSVSGGTDSFEVTYQSSAGNTQAFTINVTVGNGFLPGDVNLDGSLDMTDVDQFILGWRSDTTALDDAGKVMQGDLNLDGTTNLSDWRILHQAWNAQGGLALDLGALLATSQGDFDADGSSDSSDLQRLQSDFGPTFTGADFLNWQRNLSEAQPLFASSVSVVQEPAAQQALTLEAATVNGESQDDSKVLATSSRSQVFDNALAGLQSLRTSTGQLSTSQTTTVRANQLLGNQAPQESTADLAFASLESTTHRNQLDEDELLVGYDALSNSSDQSRSLDTAVEILLDPWS